MTGFTAVLFGISALAINILIAGVFIAWKQGKMKQMCTLGVLMIALIIPFTIVLTAYLRTGHNPWVRISLAVVLAYLITELLLDYILKIDFRSKWVTHVPYILVEYAAFAGLIYTAFTVSQPLGWAVSITFWIAMASMVIMFAGMKKKR